MSEPINEELVKAGMGVVRMLLEDNRRYERWEKEVWPEDRADLGALGAPSPWYGWRAGKRDLAQQVYDALAEAMVSTTPEWNYVLDKQQLDRLYDLLRSHGASARWTTPPEVIPHG